MMIGMSTHTLPRRKNPGAGRPHKGQRRVLTTRLPEEAAAKLEAYALANGVYMSDLLAEWALPHIEKLDLEKIDGQTSALEIAKTT